MGEWISVEDRLPEDYGNYLGACIDGEVTEVTFIPNTNAAYRGLHWSTCDADGFKWLTNDDVTHWMPLPEPPKEGWL